MELDACFITDEEFCQLFASKKTKKQLEMNFAESDEPYANTLSLKGLYVNVLF